jgi:hypothetical protein
LIYSDKIIVLRILRIDKRRRFLLGLIKGVGEVCLQEIEGNEEVVKLKIYFFSRLVRVDGIFDYLLVNF